MAALRGDQRRSLPGRRDVTTVEDAQILDARISEEAKLALWL
jgi:hypothetical protein